MSFSYVVFLSNKHTNTSNTEYGRFYIDCQMLGSIEAQSHAGDLFQNYPLFGLRPKTTGKKLVVLQHGTRGDWA